MPLGFVPLTPIILTLVYSSMPIYVFNVSIEFLSDSLKLSWLSSERAIGYNLESRLPSRR